MEMNQLRTQIRAMLNRCADGRAPALRRSRRPEFLYAADLPLSSSPEAVDRFLSLAREEGWKTETADGWVYLDRPVIRPPENGFSGPYGPEAACCLSLIRRHGKKAEDPEHSAEGSLVKAGEEGSREYERVCGILHAQWAEALRNGEMIPDVDPGFFGEESEC